MDVNDETTPLLALPGIVATAETLNIPKVSSDRALQTQFSLLVLLYARKNVKEITTGTPWEVMQQTKKRLKMAEKTESECMAIWSEFCEEEEDVESVLFGDMDGMRVVDLLDAAPDALLDDELLYATMASVWTKHARVAYILDFAARLATYGLLLSYVMHPPDRPMIYATSGEYVGGREWALLVLSLSTGSVLVLLVFVLATPPFPEDTSFGLLLVAVFVYTFQLQPVPALPLFVGLRRRVAETVFPIVALFLPALLLTCFLLSASLNGVFLTAAVPMETRSLLLFLLFATILAVFFSIILAPSPVHFGNDKWKRYGPAVCREARLTYYRTVVTYSNPCYFPPPFNLLDLVLFRSLSFLGIPIQPARTLFWRLTVGVIAYIINRLIMATSHIARFLCRYISL